MKTNSIAAVVRSVAYCAMRRGLGLLIVPGFLSASPLFNFGPIDLGPTRCTLQFNSGNPLGCSIAPYSFGVSVEAGVTGEMHGSANKRIIQVHADIEATPPFPSANLASATVSASVLYEVVVQRTLTAPDRFINLVPIIVGTQGAVTCTGNGGLTGADSSAYSKVVVGSNTVGLATCGGFANGQSDIPSFNAATTQEFTVGVRQLVNMQVRGAAAVGISWPFSAAGSFDAWADPTFAIDPSFPFASDFEIVTSLDATSTAPEPGLMGPLGLGCLALLLRKRYRPVKRAVPE